MELGRNLNRSLAIIGSAAGLSALSGCGIDKHVYQKQSLGIYGKNSWTYPNNQDKNRMVARCVGDALVITSYSTYTDTNERTWLDDPSCQDGELTSSDNFAAEAAEAGRSWGT